MCSQIADPADCFPFDDADTSSTPEPLPMLEIGITPPVEMDQVRRAILNAATTSSASSSSAQIVAPPVSAGVRTDALDQAQPTGALKPQSNQVDALTSMAEQLGDNQTSQPHHSKDLSVDQSQIAPLEHSGNTSPASLNSDRSALFSLSTFRSALFSIPGVTAIAEACSSIGGFFSSLISTVTRSTSSSTDTTQRIVQEHRFVHDSSYLVGARSLLREWKNTNFLIEAIESLYSSLKARAKEQSIARKLAEAALEAELDEQKKKRDAEERERREEEQAIQKVRAIDGLNNSPNGETPYIAAKIGGAFFSVEEAIRMARDAEQREEAEEETAKAAAATATVKRIVS